MKVLFFTLVYQAFSANFAAQEVVPVKKHSLQIETGSNFSFASKKPNFMSLSFLYNATTDWTSTQKLMYDAKFERGALGYNFSISDAIHLNSKFNFLAGLSLEVLRYKLKQKNTIYSETLIPEKATTVSHIYTDLNLKKQYNFLGFTIGLAYKLNDKMNINLLLSDEFLYAYQVERDVESNNTLVSCNFKYQFVKIPMQYLSIKTSVDFTQKLGDKLAFKISPYVKGYVLNSYRYTNQTNFDLLYVNGFENRNYLISTGVSIKYDF